MENKEDKYNTPPRFVVAIDLEMNQPSNKIIQIGAAIGEIKNRSIIRKMSYVVDPGEEITAKIEELTGVTNARVKIEGVPLVAAYDSMRRDLAGSVSDSSAIFLNPVTWGGDDPSTLRDQLDGESEWVFGRRHIDTKTLFVSWRMANGEKASGGLARSMTKLGMAFDGRKHDAGDDAYNTLRVYFKFLDMFSRVS